MTIGSVLRAAALAGVAAVFILALLVPPPPSLGDQLRDDGDAALFLAIVDRLQAGTPYYETFGLELRHRGYPSSSVANWRTPLHLSLVAALSPQKARLLLVALALMFLAVGTWALVPRGIEATAFGFLCLFGAALPSLLGYPGSVVFAEAWSGVLIGLSVVCYIRRWWVPAALFGVAAVFVRELAALYALSAGMIALMSRRRAEQRVWIIGGIAYVCYYAVHAWNAHAAMRPGDLAHLHSWVQWQGLTFVVQTVSYYGWAVAAPRLVAPFVLAGGLSGIAAPSMPPQLRAGILIYVVAFWVVGQPFNTYWGLVTAPLWGFGLVYSVEGLRTLLRGSLANADGPKRVQSQSTLTR